MVTLLNEMYSIEQEMEKKDGGSANEGCWTIRLNADHFIYQAHFPGHPVTPGICIAQIIGELLERAMGKTLELTRVANLKFTGVIEPDKTPLVKVATSWSKEMGEGDGEEKGVSESKGSTTVKAKGTITDESGEQTLTKFSLEFAEDDPTPKTESSSAEPSKIVFSEASAASSEASSETEKSSAEASASETTGLTSAADISDPAAFMNDHRICVVIPSYNNEGTVVDVIQRVKKFTDNIIFVDDGCTDSTLAKVEAAKIEGLEVVSYKPNKGKGRALREGFLHAIKRGYEYAITIDSDGQHFPEDIPLFLEAFKDHQGALLIGSRNLNQENMPTRNTFANKFSNFWFFAQTWIKLPDTQTGYRLYPLKHISRNWPLTPRYEAELELLVMAAWRGVDIIPVPVRVYYPPQSERVSHFRPFVDFMRISLLNVGLTTTAIFYGLPRRIIDRYKKRKNDTTV